jgi:hypothetical protein
VKPQLLKGDSIKSVGIGLGRLERVSSDGVVADTEQLEGIVSWFGQTREEI